MADQESLQMEEHSSEDSATEADEVLVEDHEEDASEVLAFKYSITAYGADMPVDGLVKRLRNKDILIPPFQRDYVWTFPQACRFIESLLLGLPVPGVFFSKEPSSAELMVIDGQQRLRTLQFFYHGTFGNRKFALRNVQDVFEGATYETLPPEDRRRLDDSVIHATIVKQDEPSDDRSSIYHIFERLNTGASPLRPQEIRACIFHGPFNGLLGELNDDEVWCTVYGPKSKRMKDQELILRFFALYYSSESYSRPMKEFLNDFMGANRYLAVVPRDELVRVFTSTVSLVYSALGESAFRPERALNAAVFDAVMVGLARRTQEAPEHDPAEIERKYAALLADSRFTNAYKSTTTDEANVRLRIELATTAFAEAG